jgi:hypothetical protein
MMGRKYREQANFFYEFRLDDMIPKGHLTPWLTRQSTANRSPRADSLLIGNLTGNFSNLGLFLPSKFKCLHQNSQANGTGNFFDGTGNYFCRTGNFRARIGNWTSDQFFDRTPVSD